MYTHCNNRRAFMFVDTYNNISNEPLLTEFKGPNVSYGPHFFHFNNLSHKGHKLKCKKINVTYSKVQKK